MFYWTNLVKYVLQGLVVAVALWLIPDHRHQSMEIFMIALIAAAMFAILDQFPPYCAVATQVDSYQQVGHGDGTGEDAKVEEVKSDVGTDSDSQPTVQPETNPQTQPDTTPQIELGNVCQMTGDVCTYHPNVGPDQVEGYVCKKVDDQCLPVSACKHTQSCVWDNDADKLPDASGRSCAMIDNKCKLAATPQ
jgi:hypothetical protein